MDYSSGFGSEPGIFGDPTEQPFAQHPPLPSEVHTTSATLVNDDALGSPGFAYSPTHARQTTADDVEPHPEFGSPIPPPEFPDDGGFRSPGFAGDSPAESPRASTHPDYQQSEEQRQQQQQRQEAQGQGTPRAQRQVPQYKLQAKITALERTGRKDPILRFDVHVCSPAMILLMYEKELTPG